MACKVSEIVAIIDMDGYQIKNKFLCKEMGLLKVGNTVAKSFFFDINLRWGDLTHKDRKTCSYVQNRIHKLPFGVPRGVKEFQIYGGDIKFCQQILFIMPSFVCKCRVRFFTGFNIEILYNGPLWRFCVKWKHVLEKSETRTNMAERNTKAIQNTQMFRPFNG